MKKQLLIITVLFYSSFGFSQGIQFKRGTWKEVLEKAKQINKPIFIDVYTSWCAPCKKMSKDIFPLEEVGKVYNSNFICYQIDAEEGEGIEIAKRYEVRAYPTYLFIKGDGTLFSKSLGSMEAKNFIEVSKTALANMNDPKSLTQWEKEYVLKKNDPRFLLNYMDKRSILGKSNTQLFDEYLKLLPEESRTSDTIIELYRKEESHLTINSLAYLNIQKNKEIFLRKLHESVYTFLYDGILNSLYEASKTKDEQLLNFVILNFEKLPKNSLRKSKDELYMEYYKRTGESVQYMKYATNFCNVKFMNISPDSIIKNDKSRLKEIVDGINSGIFKGIDSTQLEELKAYTAHAQRNLFSEKLNNIALEVFETVSHKNALQDALLWSKRSLEIYPNNPYLLETYANLLYKLGRNKEAIAKEKEALSFANKNNKKGFTETLRKMKSGVKTWKN